jgi:uncharacterized protein (UPF0332 family)
LAYKKGRPKQTFLRRAYSTMYYSMFHCLANCCANQLIGRQGKATSKHAWLQAYRSLEHNFACNQCKNNTVLTKFPPDIANFATVFATMQLKRHQADYDPYARFYKSAVINDKIEVETAIDKFEACSNKDKTAFASWVLLKSRA